MIWLERHMKILKGTDFVIKTFTSLKSPIGRNRQRRGSTFLQSGCRVTPSSVHPSWGRGKGTFRAQKMAWSRSQESGNQ